MNNFNSNNDDNETVRQTLTRVAKQYGWFDNPVTMNINGNDVIYYVDQNSPFAKPKQQTMIPNRQTQTPIPTANQPNSYLQNNNAHNYGVSYNQYIPRDEAEDNYMRAKEKSYQQSLMPEAFQGDFLQRQAAQQRVLQRQNMTPTHPDYSQPAQLRFDGKYLVWLQNGQPVKYYPAMSGHDKFQSARYTDVPNEGPIPEGNYMLQRNSGEYHEPGKWRTFDEFISNTGLWKKNPTAWGNSRIPIKPRQGTNTFGRHSMYVHGGTVPGSSGCIDLTQYNDDFYRDFTNYNGDLPLEVKYPKGW